jgi:hypothetical protein
MMRFFSSIPLLLSLSLSPLALAADIPTENQTQGQVPELASFESKAALLIQAIEKNDADLALPLFFPKDAFLKLKGIAKPEDYYQQLIIWFKEDIAREHERLVEGKRQRSQRNPLLELLENTPDLTGR